MEKVKAGDAVKASTINNIISLLTSSIDVKNTQAGSSNLALYGNGIERNQFDVLRIIKESQDKEGKKEITILFSGGTYPYNGELKVATNVELTCKKDDYIILNHDSAQVSTSSSATIDPSITILGQIVSVGNNLLSYDDFAHNPIGGSGGGNFSFYPKMVQTFTIKGTGESATKEFTDWVQLSGGLINYSGQFLAIVPDPEEPVIIENKDDDGNVISTEITNKDEADVKELKEGEYVILKTTLSVEGITYEVKVSDELPYPSVIAKKATPVT